MSKSLITICIVNYNSAGFVKVMLKAFRKLSFYPYKVLIRDNGSDLENFLSLKKYIEDENLSNVNLYRVETGLTGSVAHGEALNDLVAKIDTEYSVIMDADATFLLKDWDKILIEKMSDKMPIFGTQADEGGNKPKDFPLMFAVIFKTDILRNLNIDFRPRDLKKSEDTGFELREKYLSAGLSGGLLYSFSTRTHKHGPFAELTCTEYYLSADGSGSVFASHFGRGSSPNGKNLVKIRNHKNFLVRCVNRLLRIFNVRKWEKEKNEWLSICNKIINENNI